MNWICRTRLFHFFFGCMPESRVINDERGRTFELYCWCGKIETSVTFPPIDGWTLP